MSVSVPADFGPLVIETDVDVAVVGTLLTWLDHELRDAEAARGLTPGFLARPVPGNFRNALDEGEFLDRGVPTILVTTPSTNAVEEAAGGLYYVSYNVVVTSIVQGRAPAETKFNAALMGGGVKRTLLHHPDLGGFSGDLKWTSSDVAPVTDTTGQGRYLAASINVFNVYVDDAVQAGVGPYIPGPGDPVLYPDPNPQDPDQEYDPLATVTSVPVNFNLESPGS